MNIPIEVLIPIVTALVGYVFYVLKAFSSKVEASVTEQEVRRLVDDKLAVVTEVQEDIKKDVQRLEVKIDYIIKLIVKHRS